MVSIFLNIYLDRKSMHLSSFIISYIYINYLALSLLTFQMFCCPPVDSIWGVFLAGHQCVWGTEYAAISQLDFSVFGADTGPNGSQIDDKYEDDTVKQCEISQYHISKYLLLFCFDAAECCNYYWNCCASLFDCRALDAWAQLLPVFWHVRADDNHSSGIMFKETKRTSEYEWC